MEFKEEIKLDGDIHLSSTTQEEMEWMKSTLQTTITKALDGWHSWHKVKGEKTCKIKANFQLILKKRKVKNG